MSIVGKVSGAIQSLLGKIAESAGKAVNVIKRRRTFNEVSLAQTFVLSALQNPDASDDQIAQVAAQCGASVTAQAIDKRHTQVLVDFLKELFAKAVTLKVESDKVLSPLLERFTSVTILDSSTVTLPDELQEEYAGCGGSYDSSKAAMKLQTELDLRSGSIAHIEIEPGKSPDAATQRQNVSRGKGSLRITDLGYFNVPVFAVLDEAGEYFLSRLNFGTKAAIEEDGDANDLMIWLNRQSVKTVDRTIWLGKEQRLKCRMIAFRVPAEVAAERRRKLRKETMSKRGCEPTEARLAWCDWTIMVTNVPAEMMSVKEAIVLYRARWQVELLFKRWKSQNLIALLTGSTTVRQMVRVWSRLIAALILHWMLQSSVWGDPTKSLSKTSNAMREFIGRIIDAINCAASLETVLTRMAQAFAKTCRRNKRKKPGTFELLNDIDLLDFCLS